MQQEHIQEIDPRIAKQLQTATKAIDQNNEAYAIDICMGILLSHPGLLDARKILRKAQIKKCGTKSQSAFMVKLTSAPFMMKSASLLKKDPALLMNEAEKLLSVNPFNIVALKTLGAASQALDLYATAIFAYQTIMEVEPKNIENLIALGFSYLNNSDPTEAIKTGEYIVKLSPSNPEAQDLIKQASVALSMKKGDWENTNTSFTEKLKDNEETQNLAQGDKSISVSDEDVLLKFIDKQIKQVEEDPENINIYKEIVANYRKISKYDEALMYLEKAMDLPMGRGDTSLEKQKNDLLLLNMERSIDEAKAKLEISPDDAELKSSLDNLLAKEKEFKMAQAKDMVERYPNDYTYRYNLGVLLLADGNTDGAIAQFQVSQRNPKVRLNSLMGLGKCFISGKKYDLAVDQLKTAKEEAPSMNDQKKEIIYELAAAYEKMGKKDDSINELKLIYSNDIGYRDVAEQINAYYETK